MCRMPSERTTSKSEPQSTLFLNHTKLMHIQNLGSHFQIPWCEHVGYHKPTNTMRSMLLHPMNKTPKEKQCGTIYHIICNDDPQHTYVGKSKRPLEVRFKTKIGQTHRRWGTLPKHLPQCVYHQQERELDRHRCKVKEAIHIRQRRPTKNSDQGYQLPPVYDKIIPPMSEPFPRQDMYQYVIKACRSKSKRHKFQKQCSKVCTIYYYISCYLSHDKFEKCWSQLNFIYYNRC